MRRLHVAARLAPWALALSASIALAQGTPDLSSQEREIETPAAALQTEQQLNITIALPPLPSAQCSATSATQYEQRNNIARVHSVLQIKDCAVASGAFTVAVRTKDESGADKPLEFSETWQRSDEQDVRLTADYPIGENTDLVSVRVRGLTCTCADGPKEDGDPAAAAEPL